MYLDIAKSPTHFLRFIEQYLRIALIRISLQPTINYFLCIFSKFIFNLTKLRARFLTPQVWCRFDDRSLDMLVLLLIPPDSYLTEETLIVHDNFIPFIESENPWVFLRYVKQ